MKKILLATALCLSLFAAQAQQSERALFLGNSYTYVNDLPSLIAEVALSLGDTLIHDGNLLGGYTLEGHSTNATSLSKIAEGTWGYVVLQEQSQLPSFPPNQVQQQVYPYAATLTDAIRAANPCAEPMFFMTWGRENGDQVNCEFYEPLCTYEGMQQRLTESYLEMGDLYAATVSPVGEAWRVMRATYPDMGLYAGDGSHPGIRGSYLAACVFYSTIFGKSSVGAYHPTSVSAADAAILQSVASETVLSTPDDWNIGANLVTAAFDYTEENGYLQCTQASANAESHHWMFGDGAESFDANPSHIYTEGGEYTITYIASDACSTDTVWQVVEVSLYCDSVFIDSIWVDPLTGNVQLNVVNNSEFLFGYPGFILFDNNGDSISQETVNYFGIGGGAPQLHTLDISINPLPLPFEGYVNLYTGFYDSLYCSFPVSIDVSAPSHQPSPTLAGLSPNPAHGVTFLEFGEVFSGTVSLFDMAGKRVFQQVLRQRTNLPIQGDFPAGAYSLLIEEEGTDRRQTLKLLWRH